MFVGPIGFSDVHIDENGFLVKKLSRDNDEHGVLCKTRLHVGLFQRRYNGTYTQARGH